MIAVIAIGETDLWRGADLAKDLGLYNILSTIMKDARENMHIGHDSNAWGIGTPLHGQIFFVWLKVVWIMLQWA